MGEASLVQGCVVPFCGASKTLVIFVGHACCSECHEGRGNVSDPG
jgi:hypothetical protein